MNGYFGYRGAMPKEAREQLAKRLQEKILGQPLPQTIGGATIVLDDYAFIGCEEQNAMWNEFAATHRQSILSLPTGQGLMIKQ